MISKLFNITFLTILCFSAFSQENNIRVELQDAVKSGDISVFTEIARQVEIKPNYGLLSIALENQQEDMALHLVKNIHNIDINGFAQYKAPILYAARFGYEEVVSELLKRNVDTLVQNRSHSINGINAYPLLYAMCFKNASIKMVDSIIKDKKALNFQAPLVELIRCQSQKTLSARRKLLKKLLDAGANPMQVNKYGMSSLMIAASTDYKMTATLVNHPKMEESFINHVAIEGPGVNKFKTLNGGFTKLRPYAGSGSQMSALGFAIWSKSSTKTSKLLLKNGADPSLGDGLFNPIAGSIALNKPGAFKAMVKVLKKTPGALDKPIKFMGPEYDYYPQNNLSVHLTPLMLASFSAQIKFVRTLLTAGAKINKTIEGHNFTALNYALMAKNAAPYSRWKKVDLSEKSKELASQIISYLENKGATKVIFDGSSTKTQKYHLNEKRALMQLWGYRSDTTIGRFMYKIHNRSLPSEYSEFVRIRGNSFFTEFY